MAKNIFQKIINHEIHADIIYEDHRLIAIKDINPKTPGHFLVIPKNFSINLIDIKAFDLEYLIITARRLAVDAIQKLNVSGFKIEINNGKESGQQVMHTHVHVIPALK